MKKRILAFILCINLAILSIPAYALEDPETGVDTPIFSGEYEAWKNIAGALSKEYIDETLTMDQIMQMGVSNLLDGNDEMLVLLLKKTLKSLDDYSTFYTAEEFKEYENTLNRTFFGIGLELKKTGQYAEVKGFVEENSLAEQTGFKAGDKIIRIDGKDISSKTLEEIKNMLMGELNSTLNITILRGEEYIDIIATRTEVKEATVVGEILPGNIGYIRIVSFGKDTASEFAEIQTYFELNGVRNIIMNLRDNPGGRMDVVQEITNELVPAGIITYTEDKYGKREIYESSDEPCLGLPLVVLVNGNSASASEIMAGAVQDRGVGVLVGTTTYGKGIVQVTTAFKDDTAAKMTTAKYYTPNGNYIHQIGIKPDIEIDLPEGIEFSEITSKEEDVQLQTALEALKTQMGR